MSAASSTTIFTPYHIGLSAALSTETQQAIVDLLALLPKTDISQIIKMADTDSHEDQESNLDQIAQTDTPIIIKSLVDGRGLACPMPLLKTKVALRDVAVGEALYVVATDPNSQADITAFCQQSQAHDTAALALLVNSATDNTINDNKTAQAVDTIFYFIITKTGSNSL